MLIQKELLSIGEVAHVTGLPVHTLRFWENEFRRFISPMRTRGRQRRYTEVEVGKIFEIKKLLKEDKYSIAGAKQVLASRMSDNKTTDRSGGEKPNPAHKLHKASDSAFAMAEL